MTEIKPGSPLPWLVGDGEDVWDTREDGEPGIPLFRADAGAYRSWGRTITRSELLADARYIVHTANAYPSLLNGLREAREALWSILCGGNHLALLIGASHPPYTASTEDALDHYGATDAYDIWCCWREIMKARDAFDKLDTLLSQEGGQ